MIVCHREGDTFVVHRRSVLDAREIAEGEVVFIEVHQSRSTASHNHQFAEIADIWASLPDTLSMMPYARNADTLRKHALIATGHCNVQTVDAGSKAAAERVAVILGEMATKAYGYAITKISGRTVQCWTPHSQSFKAMGKERFQRSKSDILEWCLALVE